MSAYKEQETEFTDQECLVEALREKGCTVEVHKQPVALEGYQGDKRQQKAEIVLPRKNLGSASNDIGFARGANGKFKAIISDYDRSRYNQKWLKQVAVKYCEKKATVDARRKGLRLVSRTVEQNQKTGKQEVVLRYSQVGR